MSFRKINILHVSVFIFCLIIPDSQCSFNTFGKGKFPIRTLGKLASRMNLVNFTISGFSSGGAQAMQFHFAHSSRVHGAGIFSGSNANLSVVHLIIPYLYGLGRKRKDFYVNDAANMNLNKTFAYINMSAKRRLIDPLEFLPNSPVYVHHGRRDSIIYADSAEMIEKIYRNYGVYPNKKLPNMDHGMPTDIVGFGGPCATLNLIEYLVNHCQYNGVFEMFNYLYGGNLKKPVGSVSLKGEFVIFAQTQFFDHSDPRPASMDTIGYAYIPSGCQIKTPTCRLHFALHGCLQNRKWYDDNFARTTGYLETGELNDIVVVFPQVKPYMENPDNPSGCWDWLGFTGKGFGTKAGLQVEALKRMLDSMVAK